MHVTGLYTWRLHSRPTAHPRSVSSARGMRKSIRNNGKIITQQPIKRGKLIAMYSLRCYNVG